MTLHPKQLQSVANLNAGDRYSYLIRKVADSEVAFGLHSDGWAMMADSAGNRCFPIWPEPEFAVLLASNDWESCAAKPLSLEHFLEKWIPGLEGDGIKIAAFPNPQQAGVIVMPEKFIAELAAEAAQYE